MATSPRGLNRRALLAAAAGGVAAASGLAVGARSLLMDEESSAAATAARRQARTSEELLRHLREAGDGDVVTLDAGATYVLDRTMQVRGRGIVLDGAGATVRLADGAERRTDRVLDVIGDRCTVRDLVIARRAGRANGTDHSWTVQVRGSGNTVERCTVDVADGYAIGIAKGSGNAITGNTVTGGTILYAWDDVSGTRATGNRVSRTSGNAFSGTGNSDSGRPVRSCVVSDNVITDCGRIGIEDWGDVDGTRIERNAITRSRYMGISAVGARTVVARNTVQDGGTDYGIETGASGNAVTGNTIRWSAPSTATGLIVNDRWKFGGGAQYQGFSSESNTIQNATIGVSLNGRLGDVKLSGDLIADSGTRAYSLEPQSASSVTVRGAKVSFSSPASRRVQIRDGLSVANITNVLIDGCSVAFAASSAGSSKDYFVRVESRGVRITGCTFDGAARTDANRPVIGSVSGSVSTRVTTSRNTFSGR